MFVWVFLAPLKPRMSLAVLPAQHPSAKGSSPSFFSPLDLEGAEVGKAGLWIPSLGESIPK